jgi:aconitate hydratase
MGVMPLQFPDGQSVNSLGLTGREVFDITGLDGGASHTVTITAQREDGSRVQFAARVRIDTPKERDYYAHGGILPYVLRQLA